MIARIALAIAVAGLAALAVVGRLDEAAVRFVVAAHAVGAVAALVFNLLARRRLLAALARIKDAEPVVATGLIDAPETDVAQLIGQVRMLGFDVVGATDTVLTRDPVRTWVMLRPGGDDSWIEVGKGASPMAIFVGEAASGRFVETVYPVGGAMGVDTIDDPRLRVRAVTSSPADALAAHRVAMAEEGPSGRRIATMEEYLAVERVQREKTAGMRIRAHLDTAVEPSIRDWSINVAVDVVSGLALALTGSGGPG